MTPSPGTSSAGGSILTDREIMERVMRMLKTTPLFGGMSWRLLADLVRAFGLRSIGDTNRTQLDFALLAVPEHTLLVSDDSPPDAPPPRPPGVVELTRGLHMRHHAHVRALKQPAVEAPHGRAVRYYAMQRGDILTLPTHVMRSMNFAALPREVIANFTKLRPDEIAEILPDEFAELL